MASHRRLLPAIALVSLLAVACSGAAAPPPSASPSPTPVPSNGPVTSSQEAAARVLASHPEFTRIGPLNPDLIGQCCWWEVARVPAGYQVLIHVGWGDCQAGCIEKHEWTYAVSADGSIGLVGEKGSAVPAGILPGGGGPGVGPTGISGTVTAGPTCPVQQPGDPNCKPRPVAGASIIVRDATGSVVASAQSDAAGLFTVGLPPGSYTVESQPLAGLMSAPSPISVTVIANAQTRADLQYDTGIR
jgi:hypothetical protein